jgi:hypothetical protein
MHRTWFWTGRTIRGCPGQHCIFLHSLVLIFIATTHRADIELRVLISLYVFISVVTLIFVSRYRTESPDQPVCVYLCSYTDVCGEYAPPYGGSVVVCGSGQVCVSALQLIALLQ